MECWLNSASPRSRSDQCISTSHGFRETTAARCATGRCHDAAMYSHATGHELIVGAKRDAAFGTVLLVGAGGTSAELFKDRALELPPLTEGLAQRMLETLRSWPLLKGYRGKPAVDIEKLIEVLMRLSYLVADFPEIKELDVNPLLATPNEVVALDARIVFDQTTIDNPPARYSHLAIRPYPEEYVRNFRLKDHTQVLLRPIKPEDEPMWHELLGSCSSESLWFRFQYLFKKATHQMATRFCFTDYDREMAIVAEVTSDGKRKLSRSRSIGCRYQSPKSRIRGPGCRRLSRHRAGINVDRLLSGNVRHRGASKRGCRRRTQQPSHCSASSNIEASNSIGIRML